MALFTDGKISSIDELKARETEILEIAVNEGIDLTAKLDLAAQEIGVQLTAFLLQQREDRELSRVVVSPALQHWHTAHTLSLVYRDAYHRQLNDRYGEKWKLYRELAATALGTLYRVGVGIASEPIPQAQKPDLSTTPGTRPAGTYYVQVAWTNRAGAEGCPSEALAFDTPEGSFLVVKAIQPPATAVGWNVYAGLNGAQATRQNAEPIAAGGTWTVPSSGLQSGVEPGQGQSPDYYVTLGRVLRRG